MMTLTFKKGGIHPPEKKYLSKNSEIERIKKPDRVQILLNQHFGAPAKALVKKKEEVKIGQLIAKASPGLSANIHSSVAGVVEKIETIYCPFGVLGEAITIKVAKDEVFVDTIRKEPLDRENIEKDREKLLEIIFNAGIVGLGGAAFPTHIKLKPPAGSVDTLIINGVECEPYLTTDYRLMLEKTQEILKGIEIIKNILGVENVYIGIEDNKSDAIDKMKELAQEYNFKVVALKTKYPQGGEKQLIKAILDREVPSGGLPFNVGVVVQNVATAYAIYEAVYLNKPLYERVVTITGESILNPKNLIIPIGTSFKYILEYVGLKDVDFDLVINGGPMMGKAVPVIDVPTIKGSSGILVKGKLKRFKTRHCINCARCISVCPMGLNPTLLAHKVKYEIYEDINNVMDCIECGSCSYICPANIRLLDYIKYGKVIVKKKMAEAKKNG